MDLIGLFLAAFAAATVVPAQSESVLVALILVCVASNWFCTQQP
jgi:membrane protein YqaA with SNARE-associated domain